MKKRGILIWFEKDKRPELLQPFINMSDEVEFIHLYYRKRSERPVKVSPFEVIYWFDFKSPYHLLKKYKPDFIIGTTEALLNTSLVAASKEWNIPFYGLQHGFSHENVDSLLPKVQRKPIFSAGILKTYFNTARFYFSSLKLKRSGRIIQYLRLFFSFYTLNHGEAMRKNRYAWAKPDFYICFSEYSCNVYKEMYDLYPAELKFIGIPAFDEFFKGAADPGHGNKGEKYYVLIDTNFEEYNKPVSKDQINRCYQALAEYCQKNGAKLYIKLHPWSYKYEYTDDATISFLKEVNMRELGKLVTGAEGCFGFYSTLTMPIAFLRPTIQIKYGDVVEPVLMQNNITPTLDFYTFEAEDIRFDVSGDNNELMKTKFLFATDGNASERLRQILVN